MSANDKEGALILIALFLFFIAGIFISIPIMAVSIFRNGLKTFEARTYNPEHKEENRHLVQEYLQVVRKTSTSVFMILVVIFIIAAAIPFGTAVLGGGYYLTVVGVVISFIGALFAQSQLR